MNMTLTEAQMRSLMDAQATVRDALIVLAPYLGVIAAAQRAADEQLQRWAGDW
jgi:hypothetical protein